MKLALCFYGQPRFIKNPRVFNFLRDTLLIGNDVDVFAHYWFEKTIKMYERSDFSKSESGCSANYYPDALEDTEERINNMYHPVVYLREAPRDFPIPNEEDMPEPIRTYPSYRDKNLSNMKSHLYSWEKVLELFSTYRKNTGIEYDWVIVMRFDNDFEEFPNISGLDKNCNYMHGTCDVCVFQPKICEYLKPYSNFDVFLKRPDAVYDAAFWKRTSIFNCVSSEKVSLLHIKYALVRDNGPEEVRLTSEFEFIKQ